MPEPLSDPDQSQDSLELNDDNYRIQPEYFAAQNSDNYFSRVKNDLMDFNGNQTCLAAIFLIFDCCVQNLLLYLIWF